MSQSNNILLKNVKIYDKGSPHHLLTKDVHIINNIIVHIGEDIDIKSDEIIDQPGLCISPGWFDFGATCGEPGLEHRETLYSLSKAAQKGGYTAIAVFPNTNPSIDNKSMVDYITNQSKNLPAKIFPIGAVSKKCDGVELAELIDMHAAGAIAFSDGNRSIKNAGLLSKSLQYALTTGKTIINHPSDQDLVHHTYVDEGEASIFMGIKGEPALAEQLMLNRDIQLSNYTSAPIVSHLISTAVSANMINEAKKNNINIKATVSAMHLTETSQRVIDFDPAYKQSPPLRSEEDRNVLVEACQAHDIDAIVSNHTPLDIESKDLEFAYAEPGTIGLESCFAILNTKLKNTLGTELIIDFLSHQNKKCLGLETSNIIKNQSADITLFNPEEKWTFKKSDICSLSHNTAYINSEFSGRVYGTIINGALIKNKY